MRCWLVSILRIIASTSSPSVSTSLGCRIRLVQLISLTWMRPSRPGSISTNAPNWVRLVTLPAIFSPIW